MAFTSPRGALTYVKSVVVGAISDILLILPETRESLQERLIGDEGTQTELTAFEVVLEDDTQVLPTTGVTSSDPGSEADSDVNEKLVQERSESRDAKDQPCELEDAEDIWNEKIRHTTTQYSQNLVYGMIALLLLLLVFGMYNSDVYRTRATTRSQMLVAKLARIEELRQVEDKYLPIDEDGVDEPHEQLYMNYATLLTISQLERAPVLHTTHVWNLLVSTQECLEPNKDENDTFVRHLIATLGTTAVGLYVLYIHFSVSTKRERLAVRMGTGLTLWAVCVCAAFINRALAPYMGDVMFVMAALATAVPIYETIRYLRFVSNLTILDRISAFIMGETARVDEDHDGESNNAHNVAQPVHPDLLYTPQRVHDVYIGKTLTRCRGEDGKPMKRSIMTRLPKYCPGQQPGFWQNRGIPQILTRSELYTWTPSVRRELCAPFYAFPFSVVMVVDYSLYRLTPQFFTTVVSCLLGVWGCAHVFLERVCLSWLVLVVVGCEVCLLSLSVHRIQARLDLVYPWFCSIKPVWPAAVVVYSGFAFAWGCVSLCSKTEVLQNVGKWIRTPTGLAAVVVQAMFFAALYIFGLIVGEMLLIPVAMVGLGLAIIMAPITRMWCILFHLPIGFLLLVSSMHLDKFDKGVLLQTISHYLSGMFLEYAKLLLDVHYFAVIGGLVCLYSAAGNLFHEFWENYLRAKHMSNAARIVSASLYTAVMYSAAVLLTAFSSVEEHSLLHLLYSLSALGFFFFAMQPFSPYILNTQNTRNLVRQTVQINKVQDIIKGDFSVNDYMDEMQESGLKSLKKNASSVVKRRTGKNVEIDKFGLTRSTSASDTDDSKEGENNDNVNNSSGLFKVHPLPLYGWQAVYIILGMRMSLISADSLFVHIGAVLIVAVGVLGVYFHTYSIVISSILFGVVGYYAIQLEGRLMIIVSVCGIFTMAYVTVARYGASPSAFILVGLSAIYLQHTARTYIEGMNIDVEGGNIDSQSGYMERKVAQWCVEWLIECFDKITD
eukprot:CFRG7260T1